MTMIHPAIEAAAKALYEAADNGDYPYWRACNEGDRENFRAEAKAAVLAFLRAVLADPNGLPWEVAEFLRRQIKEIEECP